MSASGARITSPLRRARARVSRVIAVARRRFRSRRRRGPVCERVSEWAAANGEDVRVLVPAEHVDRRAPQTVGPSIPGEYLSRLYSNFLDKYLVTIPGAVLAGPSGLVVLPDGVPAVESVSGIKVYDRDRGALWPSGRRRISKSGRYFSLVSHFALTRGYYHWIHDALQRLYLVRDELPADVRFVVPPEMEQFQWDSLAGLGISREQTVPFSGDEEWELETLYFTNATVPSGLHRGAADRWLRDEFLASYGLQLGPARRRVYLSRAHQRRQIVNEDEVVRLLEGNGFEVVYPEELTLREQVTLMSDAEAVVASHGSSLTNILWAPEGLVVIDLVEDSQLGWAHIFWTMSEELGHRYWYLRAETVTRPGNQNDGMVPVDRLAATLEQSLGR